VDMGLLLRMDGLGDMALEGYEYMNLICKG
jgi:hypothetical protein